jgi:Protein of unknown function (DUF3606)
MDNPTKRPGRSKINPVEFKYWARTLAISCAELQKAVEKVGNSAVAVRKHLKDSARTERS